MREHRRDLRTRGEGTIAAGTRGPPQDEGWSALIEHAAAPQDVLAAAIMTDFSAGELRRLATAATNASLSQRLLSLAAVLD